MVTSRPAARRQVVEADTCPSGVLRRRQADARVSNHKPIRSLYVAWRTACQEAGHPGMLMHDFRRTAVRNLERAGVPRSAAMKMTGHKTEAVYCRYAIVDEAMWIESGEKHQAFHASHAEESTGSVVPLRHAGE